MKINLHLRFGLYLFSMWAFCAVIVWSFYGDARWLPLVLILAPVSMSKILGPSFEDWRKAYREVSGRSLVVGFLIFLVIFWVGGITIAHYISPGHQTPKYIPWTIAAVLWLVCVIPGYLWWRTRKGKVDA